MLVVDLIGINSDDTPIADYELFVGGLHRECHRYYASPDVACHVPLPYPCPYPSSPGLACTPNAALIPAVMLPTILICYA